MCSLVSGSTHPDTIKAIAQLSNVKLKHLTDPHAKVVPCANEAILGSANLPDNGFGLSLDGEARLVEAGVVVHDATQLSSAGEWFEVLWGCSETITEPDLKLAREDGFFVKQRHATRGSCAGSWPTCQCTNSNRPGSICRSTTRASLLARSRRLQEQAWPPWPKIPAKGESRRGSNSSGNGQSCRSTMLLFVLWRRASAFSAARSLCTSRSMRGHSDSDIFIACGS